MYLKRHRGQQSRREAIAERTRLNEEQNIAFVVIEVPHFVATSPREVTAAQQATTSMYDTILFPTDGSNAAESVLEYALQIASEHEATIHILNVADTGRDSVTTIRGEVIDVLETEGERIVAEATQYAKDEGVPVVSAELRVTRTRRSSTTPTADSDSS